jgi:hypothetical protein
LPREGLRDATADPRGCAGKEHDLSIHRIGVEGRPREGLFNMPHANSVKLIPSSDGGGETFGKSTIPLVYEIEEWAPPKRVVLTTSSKRFDAVDTITFVELDDDRTRVVHVAEFELKGVMRLLAPVVRPMFARLGKKALDGLASQTA